MTLKNTPFILIALFLILGSYLQSAEPFGKITKLEGEPKVIRRLKPLDVATGEDLFIGDRIRTKVSDRLEIKTTFDDIITVAPRTSMVLKNQSKDKKKKEVFLELLGGTIRTKVQPLDKDETFLVRTPVTVAGVRGTDFLSSSDGTTVVFEGKVAVIELENAVPVDEQLNESAPPKEQIEDNKVKEVIVTEKQRVRFNEEGRLSEPQRVSNLEVKATENRYTIEEPVEKEEAKTNEETQQNKEAEDKEEKKTEKSEDNKESAVENKDSQAAKDESTAKQVLENFNPKSIIEEAKEGVDLEGQTEPESGNESDSGDEPEIDVEKVNKEAEDEIGKLIEQTTEEQAEAEVQNIIDEIQKETETFILRFILQHRDN